MTACCGGHMKINTEYIYPPIPCRRFDWCAVYDGYEPGDPIGYGATEEDAIEELINERDSD